MYICMVDLSSNMRYILVQYTTNLNTKIQPKEHTNQRHVKKDIK